MQSQTILNYIVFMDSISKSGIYKRIATLSTAAEDNCTTRMLLAVAAHCSKSDPPSQDGKSPVDSLL